MTDLGKLLIIFGAILLVVGLLFAVLGRTHLPLAHLPGDIYYRGKHTTVYFPITTCLVVSIVLSLVTYLVNRLRH